MTTHPSTAHDRDRDTPGFCAWCGSGLVSKAYFCSGCGREIASPTLDASVSNDEHTTVIPALEAHPLDAEPAPGLMGQGAWRTRARERMVALAGGGRNRWLVVVTVGLAVLLLASLVGVAGYRHVRDAPAREAFADAQRLFGPVASSFGSARDLEQVVQAGQTADQNLAALRRHHVAATGVRSDKASAVAGVIAAELDVLRAGAATADLDEQDFGSWADTHRDLERGLADLEAATRRLAIIDEDAAASVAGTGRLLTNLERVVGRSVATSAEESLAISLTALADAKATSEVRAAAETAAKQQAAIVAAVDGLPEDADATAELETLAEVYGAVAGLALLDGSTLARWGVMRQDLTVALGGTGVGSEISTAGRRALRGLDRLVARAETRLSDWEASYDAAVARDKNDAVSLDKYATKMQAQLKRYATLRTDLGDWIEWSEDPTTYVTYEDAYTTLSTAQWDRQLVRDAMTGLDVPVAVGDAHNELVSVLDDAIVAMQAAYDGAVDSDYCVTSCRHQDTPGWQRFLTESRRISEAFAAAEQDWQTAVAGARAEIDNRILPRKPRV